MSKLWIIGDSFTACGEGYWAQTICNKFKGTDYYVSSKASRDFQTILDIFLRKLKDIKKEDFVIITVPTLTRVRLPRLEVDFDVEYSPPNSKSYHEMKLQHYDFFIGASSYQPEKTEPNFKIEYPLTDISNEHLHRKLNINYAINASNASKQNYIEILKSLKQYLPFEIFIWSWTDEMISEIITSKSEIKDKIGFWHTINDIWEESGGKSGKKGDEHFSPKMHKAFTDYLIVKFPQFFNV